MADRVTVVEVAFDVRAAGSEAVFTYSAPDRPAVGQAWLAPIGSRAELGHIVSIRESRADALGFPIERLKPLSTRVEDLDLPAGAMELATETARQTLSSIPVAIGLVRPPGAQGRLIRSWKVVGSPTESLPPIEAETYRLVEAVGEWSPQPKQRLEAGTEKALRSLVERGLLQEIAKVVEPRSKGRAKRYRLTSDDRAIDEFLSSHSKRKPAQTMALLALQGSESVAFTLREIAAMAEVGKPTIQALVESHLLVEDQGESAAVAFVPSPNLKQAAAIDRLVDSIGNRDGRAFLLFGVTGSGKTEVYLRAAEDALKRGRQVAYLVPEIALTAQVIAQLRSRFGDAVAVLHSGLTPTERLENWLKIRRGDAPIVLGPRSAIFAPFTDLGLIVMDEEHESSYKQDSAPRYHTRALAEWLTERRGSTLVLGSATPSVETFRRALDGELELLELPERAADAKLPAVQVVDLSKDFKEKRLRLFSPSLKSKIEETLARDEQIILFLNRRAYSPSLMCRSCGSKIECPNCGLALSFHKRDSKLKCHHCGYEDLRPDSCPKCGSESIGPIGIGGERVQEIVEEEFGLARVGRLDRDVVQRKGALEEVLTAFRSGETNVLVGTQMVAKGLDFPNVTLVGVLAADISLSIPDFRASERTFQLLSQVAGRAGRGLSPGEVVIQTFNPEHVSVTAAQSHDYRSFFDAVSEERRLALYPPFVRLANVLVNGTSRSDVIEASQAIAHRVRAAFPEDEVLGPVDCNFERLAGRWRRHVLIKLEPKRDPEPLREAVRGVAEGDLRVVVDLDAQSLL